MDWQRYFTEKVIRRGIDYYENGNVVDIIETAKGYKAEVEGDGGNVYRVDLELDDELIMDCECIYAQEVGPCKHMAAVFHALDEGYEVSEERDIVALIDQLSKEELKALVLSASQHQAMEYKLQLLGVGGDYSRIKRRLKQIVRKYTRYGVAYENMYEFSEEIIDFIEQDLYQMSDALWECKVECIKELLSLLENLSVVADCEDIWLVYTVCYEMLAGIIGREAERLGRVERLLPPHCVSELHDYVVLDM